MRIGFLGWARWARRWRMRLIAAGHELSVWNRTEGRTEPLLREGAIAAATPAEAELGADAVITMLFDDAAHEEVLFGPNGLMDALSPGALHIAAAPSASRSASGSRASTRGAASTLSPRRLRPAQCRRGRQALDRRRRSRGRRRQGARPLLEPLSRGISVVGNEPRQAHALKLGGNFLISAMIHSLSESFVYAEAQGIDAGDLSRDGEQRAVPVAVLRGLRQGDAASAGEAGRHHRAGREGSAPAARSRR